MKIDARLVKQSVGMIVGGVIFAWSAMDKGRIDGIKEGKRLQAGWTERAIEDAYEKENKFWNYSITIGNMIVTLAFGLGVGLVVLLFTLIVRSILSKK